MRIYSHSSRRPCQYFAGLPVSAAVCKMGFNEVNLVKNKFRSLLHNDTLNSLLMMHVSDLPPDLFQLQSAIDD
jgi:hypothetical protein